MRKRETMASRKQAGRVLPRMAFSLAGFPRAPEKAQGFDRPGEHKYFIVPKHDKDISSPPGPTLLALPCRGDGQEVDEYPDAQRL